MLIIPTVHLVYAPVVALAAVFAHVTHKKGPSSGRGVGSLDVARLAFAVAALIVRVASDSDGEEDVESPEDAAGFLSAISFAWMSPLLATGYERPLESDDLFPLTRDDDPARLAVPVLLSRLLKALADDHALAYRLAAALTINAVVATAFLHQYFQRTYRTGMRLKSAAISLVFDKALVARTAGAEDEGALVTNLMSVDAQRLQDNMTYMFTIVSGVYQIVATLYLLYGQLGPASFGGLAKVVLEYKDRRIKLQSEALAGMKIVKLYGWEPPLGEELDRLRELELAALWKYKLAGIVSRCVFSVVPTVVAVATFTLYVLTGNELDVARVYTTLARAVQPHGPRALRRGDPPVLADGGFGRFADGDLTEIGEKGLTLSGGQKQRVALARAFYADADVYLLDDCLSAVDAHVAAALFDDLVLHLRDQLRRTVVLVTHNLSTLRKCDAVVCLGAGSRTVDYAGPPEGFLDLGRADPERYPLAAIAARQKRSTSGEHLSALAGDEAEAKEQDKATTLDAEKKPPHATAAEQREKGTISAATRRTYLMATGGSAMALLVVCAQVVYQASQVVGSWWLGYWAARPQLGSALGLEVYVGLSAVAVALSVVAYYVASLLGQRAARKLHASLLSGLLKAPMAFFDGTPTGRLVNLFSKDLYTIDEELPVTIAMWLMVATSCVATMATIAFATPWFLAVCLPLGVVYFGTMKYFIPSVRELKRLDATSRSPVFVAFGEALDGASTIRAFRAEKRFAADQGAKLRKNLRAYFLGTACNRWLAPYLAGLSLTYALSVTQSLNWFVRTNADLENNSVAVERVVNCADTAPEADGHAGPPDGWPSKGDVTVTNLQLRYRPELPLVLKGLNFAVDGGTKLALVGRTGSGKSSFLLALLRLAPPAPGSKLVLDGVDVLSVKLADLRTRVSMIPQDPVLFSGTVRFNVDPFAAAADGDVRDALRDARLDDKLAGDDPLGAPVEEGGRNFSLGERQLLCLARACLRKSKLLLLDEATSAVDEALDEAVQLAIRANFKHSTVICIAHRINTIADYDASSSSTTATS
ncbi:ATPase [Aureococcus anophagefferens]|nr:ATPase [Aureococcus anophagefferens]